MRPPLGLSVVARDPGGAEATWWSGDRQPGNRPQGLTFSTRRGEGFSSAACTLARRADIDHADLNLLDEYVIVGDTGDVAWEGRLATAPRTIEAQGGHSIAPTLVGWIAHAKDRRFSEIYVDRDLSAWGGASTQRRINALSFNYVILDASVAPDVTNHRPSIVTEIRDTWAATALPNVIAVYDAGPGVPVGSIYYAWERGSGVSGSDPSWDWRVLISDTDDLSDDYNDSGNLRAAGPGSGTFSTTAAARRFVSLVFTYTAAGGIAGGAFPLYWTCAAVYGTHGLTKRGTGDATSAPGLHLSDIVKDIAQRFCPKLNVDGVRDNTTIVPHCAFKDRTFPYDAWLELNGMALWELAVWEDKTLTYEPADLTDYDWEVRLDDYGFSTTLNGDDAEDLANGIEIEYDDVQTGKRNLLTPDGYTELLDTNPDNPANRQGYPKWASATIPFPTSKDIALQIGRGLLAEQNTPKEAGEIRVRGWVRDRGGHWQPAWRVRAGDTIAITDFPNSRPRLIGETDYDDTSKELRVAVDSTFKTMEAYTERTVTALKAANLV